MKKITLLFSALCLSMASFAQNELPPAKKGDVYGTEFQIEKEQTNFENLPELLNENDTISGQFIGEVSEVCSKKGCWLNVTIEGEEHALVKMDGYSFFLPMNVTGKKIALDGYAYKEVVPVAELRHYAEDAGKSKEEILAIDKPEMKYRLIAKGIVILE